jgi:hypothetical protein
MVDFGYTLVVQYGGSWKNVSGGSGIYDLCMFKMGQVYRMGRVRYTVL